MKFLFVLIQYSEEAKVSSLATLLPFIDPMKGLPSSTRKIGLAQKMWENHSEISGCRDELKNAKMFW